MTLSCFQAGRGAATVSGTVTLTVDLHNCQLTMVKLTFVAEHPNANTHDHNCVCVLSQVTWTTGFATAELLTAGHCCLQVSNAHVNGSLPALYFLCSFVTGHVRKQCCRHSFDVTVRRAERCSARRGRQPVPRRRRRRPARRLQRKACEEAEGSASARGDTGASARGGTAGEEAC